MNPLSLDRSVEEWTEWLQSSLDGEISAQELQLARDEELHEALIGAYLDSNPPNQRRFEKALVRILGSVPLAPGKAEIFFRLFQVVAVVKPIGGDVLLKKFLADGVVGNYEYDGRPLRNTLLSVAAQYPVDEWLTEFLWKTVKASDDFLTLLVCYRCLSFRMDDAHLDVLLKLIPQLGYQAAISRLARQLFADIGRNHCIGLRRWYIEHDEWIACQSELVRDGFLTALFEVLKKVEEIDDHARLLLAEVTLAKRLPLSPEHLLAIAGMDRRVMPEIKETLTRLQCQWHKLTGDYLWFVRKLNGRQFRTPYYLTDREETFIVPLTQEMVPILGNTVPADALEFPVGTSAFGAIGGLAQA
jgi:hypothetical protein